MRAPTLVRAIAWIASLLPAQALAQQAAPPVQLQAQVQVQAPEYPPVPVPPAVPPQPGVPMPQATPMMPGVPMPQAMPPGMPMPPPMMPSGPVVVLRTTDYNATLYRLAGVTTRWGWYRYHPVLRSYESWQPLCRTPCGIELNPNDLYSIRGFRVVPSNPFQLPPGGMITLTANVGHTGPRVGGVLLTTFGGIAAVLGITFTAVGAGTHNLGNPINDPSAGMLTAGEVLLGLGGGMLIGGIVLLVASRTTVHTVEGYRLAQSYKPPRLALSGAGLVF